MYILCFCYVDTTGCVAVIYSESAATSLVVHNILKQRAELSVEECYAVSYAAYTVAVFNRESSDNIAPSPAIILYNNVTALSRKSKLSSSFMHMHLTNQYNN